MYVNTKRHSIKCIFRGHLTGEKALADMLHSSDWKLITTFKTRYIERLRQYYYVGGMPEAVAKFTENYNFQEVREIQKELLITYEHDFSKYAPSGIVPRIRMIWNSIPGQLARENRKFIFGAVRHGSRAKDYGQNSMFNSNLAVPKNM